jgi:hypothetical protein
MDHVAHGPRVGVVLSKVLIPDLFERSLRRVEGNFFDLRSDRRFDPVFLSGGVAR